MPREKAEKTVSLAAERRLVYSFLRVSVESYSNTAAARLRDFCGIVFGILFGVLDCIEHYLTDAEANSAHAVGARRSCRCRT